MASIAGNRVGRANGERPGDGRQLRYTTVAIVLHWAIALGILYNLATGLFGYLLPRGAFAFHISSGITVLALTVVRVAWRLTHRPPPKLPMPAWQKRLADGVYALFYAGMILLPLSGWALVSAHPPAGSPGAAWAAEHPAHPEEAKPLPAAKSPVEAGQAPAPKPSPAPKRTAPMIWGLFALPSIGPVADVGRTPGGVPEQRELHERIEGLHLAGGWIMLALLVLHVAGALKHQFMDRERELQRMGLGRGRTRAAG